MVFAKMVIFGQNDEIFEKIPSIELSSESFSNVTIASVGAAVETGSSTSGSFGVTPHSFSYSGVNCSGHVTHAISLPQAPPPVQQHSE